MRTKYQKAIEYLENKLSNDYDNIISELKFNVFDKLDVNNNPCAERSLAFFSNNIFGDVLQTYGLENYIMSEVHISPNIKLSETTKFMYAKKTNINKALVKDKYNGMIVPDTLILIRSNNINFTYFIEYKVHHNSFSYIKLAYDYLKYKIYTHNSIINTKFIYIIFNYGIKPTIISAPNVLPKIQFIDEIISSKVIDKTANIFIYDPDSLNDSLEESPIDEIIGFKELSKLENIIKSIDIIENNNLNINYEKIENLSNNVYVKNIDALGKKVVNSKLMISHYESIKNIVRNLSLNVCELIDNVNRIDNKNIKSEEELYEWMERYYRNYIKMMYDQDKPRNNEAISKVIKRKTMMFLIAFDKFCKINKISGFEINFKKLKEKEDYENLRRTVFMESYHTEGKDKEKFNVLIKTILYFITNLYKVMYENEDGIIIIDENSNACYNENYLIYLEKKKIIESITSIKYLFSINNKSKVVWESDISELGEEIFKLIVDKTFSLK